MKTIYQAWTPVDALSRPLTRARLLPTVGDVRPSTAGISPKSFMGATDVVVRGGFDAADEGPRTWSPPV